MALRYRFAGSGNKPPQGGQSKELWLEALGEKAYEIRQVRCVETNANEPLMRCRKRITKMMSKPVHWLSAGISLEVTCLPTK
ncbi:hypothetical protein BTJ40_15650 [Microbulbifer sp. A4B17]|nr:hypothetical protein BTJ40_15650 [Microbulbifer sp. A4B17]